MMPNEVLPHDDEAERAVLGAIMLEPGAAAAVIPILQPEHFYRADHQKVYAAMLAIHREGRHAKDGPIDIVLLRDQLRHMGAKDVADNADLFMNLSGAVPSIANAEHYARNVHPKAALRNLRRVGIEIAAAAESEDSDAVQLAELKVRAVALGADLSTPCDNVEELTALIERAEQGIAEEAVLPTGIGKLDVTTHGGFRRGELVILGGRPGSGKSSAALNLFRNGLRKGYRMAFFTLEVTQRRFLSNLIACTAGVNSQTWRDAHGHPGQWARVKEAADELLVGVSDTLRGCLVDDSVGLTPLTLQAKCERFAAGGGADFVFVDHIHLMSGDQKGASELERLTEISRALKLLAKEQDCVVIALSQLSRASAKDERAPRLDDLRSSGTIEQDADLVIMMHDTPPDKNKSDKVYRHDWRIEKQRHGPCAILKMEFISEHLRFMSFEADDEGDLDDVPFD